MTSMREIAAAVAASHNLILPELKAWDRRAPIAKARQRAMYEQKRLGFTGPQIARFWGRDHTTVSHACRQAEQREKESE